MRSRQKFLLESDDPATQNFLLHQYEERIEKLSQQDKLSKFCKDAGFLSVVEFGQYFMTKDTAELSHFADSVACREYIFQETKFYLNHKVGSNGTPTMGPY